MGKRQYAEWLPPIIRCFDPDVAEAILKGLDSLPVTTHPVYDVKAVVVSIDGTIRPAYKADGTWRTYVINAKKGATVQRATTDLRRLMCYSLARRGVPIVGPALRYRSGYRIHTRTDGRE